MSIYVHDLNLMLAVRRALLNTSLSTAFYPNDPVKPVDCADAHRFLTDVMQVKGYHVLCIESTANDLLRVTGFKDGMHANSSVTTTMDLQTFQRAIEVDMLQIPEPTDDNARKYKQLPAYFSPEGEKLKKDTLTFLQYRVVFLFEGGQFFWPAVVKNTFGRGDLVLETISMTPLVFSVEEFLRDDEIDIILELSMPHLATSGVSLQDGHENRPATDWRTSTMFWLDSSLHPVVKDIDKRTADLVKVPISHQEPVQVLRYERTQHYDQHVDYFSPDRLRNSPDLIKKIEHGYKNRMITVFWYMSNVTKGGHTNFARSGGLPAPSSNKECSSGISVAPKKRKVVVFYNLLPNGEGDPMSLHAGCAVEEGTKLSGNKWVWNKPRYNND
ncbi:hypothetical protein CCR75_000400 [Bremia lactucae]|uniref:Fe2OG dioxygenase domain-containing protein n=1 Tax=Bremia lactucae TaxID=4779 RepID=A0A976IDM5_BRELC|nr:hypothetical protein CCR75_000400 [Bremia lactucae]